MTVPAQESSAAKYMISEPVLPISIGPYLFVSKWWVEIPLQYWRNDRHAHRALELLYVTEGKGTATIHGNRLPLTASSVLVVFPGEPHSIEADAQTGLALTAIAYDLELQRTPGMAVFPATCAPEWPRLMRAFLRSRVRIRPDTEHRLVGALLGDMRHCMRGGFVGWDLNSRWFAERAVLLNVACLFAPQVRVEIPVPPRAHCEPIHYEQGDPLVQGFYREILLRHAEDLSLADVAKHLHVSTRKLQRMLQSQGVSFVGYLHDVRMKMAGVLMLRDDSPLAEVARAVGIPDPSYFSKVFLKHYGVSPTGYRRFLKEHV